MRLGYQRPLQATDLWKMDPSREADHLSAKFLSSLERRQKAAEEWNAKLPNAKVPLRLRAKWRLKSLRRLPAKYAKYGGTSSPGERRRTLEAEWRAESGRRHGSITGALNDTFPSFWYGGLFKVMADTSQLMGPLVVKAIINFSKEGKSLSSHGWPCLDSEPCETFASPRFSSLVR